MMRHTYIVLAGLATAALFATGAGAATLGDMAEDYIQRQRAERDGGRYRYWSEAPPPAQYLDRYGETRGRGAPRDSGYPDYSDPPPPWIAREHGRPVDRTLSWTYGQASGADDPYTWRYLDNGNLRLRWGNPMAPWSSGEMWDWWRRRSGVPGYFSPVW